MTPHPPRSGAPGGPAQEAGAAGLDLRTHIRIDLFLARRRVGPGTAALKILALRELGRAAGMNSAEMLANEAGDSHEARSSACLAFVAALLACRGSPPPDTLRRMGDAGYRPADIDDVIARVGREAA